MENLASILMFRKTVVGYGHYRIEMRIENPYLKLDDDDNYWKYNNREEEPKEIYMSCISTNSRAIDGYDGGDKTLAIEVLTMSDIPCDLIDLNLFN